MAASACTKNPSLGTSVRLAEAGDPFAHGWNFFPFPSCNKSNPPDVSRRMQNAEHQDSIFGRAKVEAVFAEWVARACPNGLESRNHLGLRVKMSEA